MKLRDLNEKILNLKSKDDYEKNVDVVWDLLQESYKSIGGIKGTGFESKEHMKALFMWKLTKKNNEIVAGLIYKNRHSTRKTVAVFTDGSQTGKQELRKMLEADIKRSSIEISHSLLKFYKRHLPDLIRDYAIPVDQVQEILKKPIEKIPNEKYEYLRDINHTTIRKMMLGTVVKPF